MWGLKFMWAVCGRTVPRVVNPAILMTVSTDIQVLLTFQFW